MKMVSLDKCLLIKSEVKLKEQADIRAKLRESMVGTLYPEILLCEIMKINSKLSDLRRNK